MNYRYIVLLAGFISCVGTIDQASACVTRDTCLDIRWCMNPANGHEFSGPLVTAARGGDGQGVGADASACQNKYGQNGPHNWGWASAGCLWNDYANLGKKALANSCD